MTGSYPGDEQHVVVHHDGGDGEQPSVTDSPLDEQVSILQRYRYWLYGFIVLVGLGAIVYGIGEATYEPPSRLPQLVFSTREPLYGNNSLVASEMDLLRASIAADAPSLEAYGLVFRIALPRTLGDRLFSERDEVVTIFSAHASSGDYRFLLLTEGGAPAILAIESPFSRSSPDQPTGVFLAIDPADAAFDGLRQAVEAEVPTLEDLQRFDLEAGSIYVFGPFLGGDVEGLRDRVEGNTVMGYLSQVIEAAPGEHVSAAAPFFLVTGGPARGTIEAIYHPARRAVMEPLWGHGTTAILAHELVHAYFDTVAANRLEMLSAAATYLERAHPVLHGEVVGDLYQRLGREARAEESLAFIAGAIAAQQTQTVASQRILENPGNLAISEAILFSDVRLLVQYGILPPCMLPGESASGRITSAYYDAATLECRQAAPSIKPGSP